MDESKSYIGTDEHGVKRVGGTRISLDSVIIGFRQGESPEEIQRNFPVLTLEQVYGAIAHYLGRRVEVDEYLQKQSETFDRLRALSEEKTTAVVERLKRARSEKAGQLR